jgi:hypothetical protein
MMGSAHSDAAQVAGGKVAWTGEAYGPGALRIP